MTTPTPTPTGSSRLERAARAAARIACEMIAGNPTLLTTDAVDAIVDRAARQALAEAEAGRAGSRADPRCTRCGEPVTLMQSQLPDEVGLPCHKNCPAPAQAGEAVAWAARDGFGKVVVLEPTERKAKAQSVRRALEVGGGPLPVFPLYAAPSRPGGAAPPAIDAAQLERVAREAAGRAWRLGYIRGANGARNWSDSDQADVVARAIAAAKGGAS